MNFKFIYEGLSKKIIFSFLTIIQFTIGLLCIFIALQNINDVNRSISSVNKYFSKGNYYKTDNSISLNELHSFDTTTINEDMNTLIDIKNYLENNKNMEFLSVSSDVVFLKKEEALTETIVTYDPIDFQNTKYIRTQGFCVNKNFLKYMEYSFLEGDINDFEISNDNNYTPVILGNIYKDKYKVGDLIESLDFGADSEPKKTNLKVIGILDDNNYVYEDGILAKGKSLKNAIIYPYNENILLKDRTNERVQTIIRVGLSNYLSNSYVLLNDNEYANDINNHLLSYKFKFQLKDLNDSMDEYKNQIMHSIKPVIYTSGIIILFSIISITIVMLNSIIKDKKEFGINIMIGATMKDIRTRVLGQVFLLLGISILISTIILKSFNFFTFNIVDFALTILVMIVALIVISTIIILTLNKYSINDLIRRSE